MRVDESCTKLMFASISESTREERDSPSHFER